MCIEVLAASTACHCGGAIQIKADTVPFRGVCGRYESDGGRQVFYMIATCHSCSTIFEPDHDRFASYFNEAKYRVFR